MERVHEDAVKIDPVIRAIYMIYFHRNMFKEYGVSDEYAFMSAVSMVKDNPFWGIYPYDAACEFVQKHAVEEYQDE